MTTIINNPFVGFGFTNNPNQLIMDIQGDTGGHVEVRLSSLKDIQDIIVSLDYCLDILSDLHDGVEFEEATNVFEMRQDVAEPPLTIDFLEE